MYSHGHKCATQCSVVLTKYVAINFFGVKVPLFEGLKVSNCIDTYPNSLISNKNVFYFNIELYKS